MRLDDNGNEFLLADRLSLEEASEMVATFEARAHKQQYVVQQRE